MTTHVRALTATGLAVVMFAAGAILLAAEGGRSAAPAGRDFTRPQLIGTEVASASDVDATITNLQERLRAGDESPLDLSELGAAYLQKARQTADPAYYELADKALTRALAIDSAHLPALLGAGELALARHDFAGGLAWGQRALVVSEVNATALGVVGDAYVGLGHYGKAFGTYQKMVDSRPDLSSYTRVSYARELSGDVPGAIDAMRRAGVAGAAVPENQAWTNSQLGDLHFAFGSPNQAALQYRAALDVSPEFTPALAGLARVDAARGLVARAIARFERVVERMPLPQYVILLGDLYAKQGRMAVAEEQYDLVRAQSDLYEANGVLPDVEMTLFFADQGRDPRRALALARSQYRERKSIQVADALAWSLYRRGHVAAARSMFDSALKLGTRDALMHFHAGMIAIASNDEANARRHLATAVKINRNFSILFADKAHARLARLRETR
jgi:tetratricopeptide (TPR) repeat protein